MRWILPILFVTGCSPELEVPGKITVGVSHAKPVDEPMLNTFDSDIRVENLVVNIAAVEFHRCVSTEPHAFKFSFVPNAFAHVSGDSTRLGSPYVEDFLQIRDGVRVIGEISPPAGEYCRGYIVVSPADDDAMNLTDVDMLESSAAIIGQHRDLLMQEWTGFEQRSVQRATYEFPLKLKIDPIEQKSVSLRFNGIDAALSFVDPGDVDAVDRVVEALMTDVVVQ